MKILLIATIEISLLLSFVVCLNTTSSQKGEFIASLLFVKTADIHTAPK